MNESEESSTTAGQPTSTQQMITRIESEWQRLNEALAGLSPRELEQTREGGWAIKDHLNHIAFWEKWLVRYHVGGENPRDLTGMDTKEFIMLSEDGANDIIYRRTKALPLEDVLAEFQSAHNDVLSMIKELPFSRFMEPRYEDDPEKRPLILWVDGTTADHYREHREMIERQLGEKK